MGKTNILENTISTKQLLKEFNWYGALFPETVEASFEDYFTDRFDIKMIGVSKNINCLHKNEACFVTKVKINEEYDLFFRFTDLAIDVILNAILGKAKSRFNINKITPLEARIITSFNYQMYETIRCIIKEPSIAELKRKNFDVIHLTFIIKDREAYDNKVGKFIITIPQSLLEPQVIKAEDERFTNDDFYDNSINVKAVVGRIKFSLYDIKHLEVDDLVIFEDSDINNIQLYVQGDEIDVKIEPHMELTLADFENDEEGDEGEDEMGKVRKNIWDTLEVELRAEFDTVNISLGDLKRIEEGLVMDIASLYENNVTLKVENKALASGSLVIVNDRYGVKINKILFNKEGGALQDLGSEISSDNMQSAGGDDVEEDEEDLYAEEENNSAGAGEDEDNSEEEFDYSDFELDDDSV